MKDLGVYVLLAIIQAALSAWVVGLFALVYDWPWWIILVTFLLAFPASLWLFMLSAGARINR